MAINVAPMAAMALPGQPVNDANPDAQTHSIGVHKTGSARCDLGTVVCHLLPIARLTMPYRVVALTHRMAVSAPSALLIAPRRCLARLTAGDTATARTAILLSAVAARAVPYLTPTACAHQQTGIVDRSSPGRGGLDGPYGHSNTVPAALLWYGSRRSLAHDRQV